MSTDIFLKVEGKRAPRVNMDHPNLRIWSKVCKTDEDMLKAVTYGDRTFSSIDPYAQIRNATAAFGPMGEGWKLEVMNLEYLPMTKKVKKTAKNPDGQVVGYQIYGHFRFVFKLNEVIHTAMRLPDGVQVDSREGGVITASFELMNDIFSDPNSESMKKIFTDTLTKALSFLGFNADVFLGAFEGTRYVGTADDRCDQELIDKLIGMMKKARELMIISSLQEQAALKKHESSHWNETAVKKDIEDLQRALDKRLKKKEVSDGNVDAAAVDGGSAEGEAQAE